MGQDLAKATIEDLTVSLARRIASSPAQDVILLEEHTMPFGRSLLESEQACGLLVNAGFKTFFLENDADAVSVAQQTAKRNVEKHDAFALDYITRLQKQAEAGQTSFGLKICEAGFGLVTAYEAVVEARKQLKRERLLVEGLWLVPMNKQFETEHKDANLFYFLLLINKLRDPNRQQLVSELIGNLSDGDVRDHVQYYGKPQKLKATVYEELELLEKLFQGYRDFGNCDTASIEYALQKKEGRSVFKWGSFHGVIANNPQSLPDQLETQLQNQGTLKAGIEVLQMMAPPSAQYFHKLFKQLGNNLRESVTVYDIFLKQEWPILDWIAQAPTIYRNPLSLTSAKPQPLKLG